MTILTQLLKRLRQLVVLATGLPLLAFGVFLIPLPGPGLLIVFLGLLVLSMEFAFAEKYLNDTRLRMRQVYDAIVKK